MALLPGQSVPGPTLAEGEVGPSRGSISSQRPCQFSPSQGDSARRPPPLTPPNTADIVLSLRIKEKLWMQLQSYGGRLEAVTK